VATDSQQLAGELAAMMDEQHEFLARTGTGPAESDSPQVRPDCGADPDHQRLRVQEVVEYGQRHDRRQALGSHVVVTPGTKTPEDAGVDRVFLPCAGPAGIATHRLRVTRLADLSTRWTPSLWPPRSE
jgi:hypothetical protein